MTLIAQAACSTVAARKPAPPGGGAAARQRQRPSLLVSQPLFRDAELEIELLELLPHIKRLLTLQVRACLLLIALCAPHADHAPACRKRDPLCRVVSSPSHIKRLLTPQVRACLLLLVLSAPHVGTIPLLVPPALSPIKGEPHAEFLAQEFGGGIPV